MTLQALPWLPCRMHGVLPVLWCRNPVLQTILAALHGEQELHNLTCSLQSATSSETLSLLPGEVGSRLVGSDNLESSAYPEPGFFLLSVLPEEVWELCPLLSPDSLAWKRAEEQPGQGLGVHFSLGVNCTGGGGERVLYSVWGDWPFPPPNSTD